MPFPCLYMVALCRSLLFHAYCPRAYFFLFHWHRRVFFLSLNEIKLVYLSVRSWKVLWQVSSLFISDISHPHYCTGVSRCHQRRDQHKCVLCVCQWNPIVSNCQDKARDWPLPWTIFSETTHTWACFEISSPPGWSGLWGSQSSTF